MARFTLPRDLYHGKGALEALKSFRGKKAMICVGGGSMKRFGFLDRAIEYLKEAGMEVELFEGIEPDPSVETVMKGAEAMLKFEPDWIVAMGGGSPIDAAKAMWIKYEYPDITFEDMCKVFGIPSLRKKAHFCAISSTSGTATEVTAFSIITDYEKGIKYPIADFEITPDVAIVDPDLAETMPQKLVAHTGMDAMTHAVEAYVSTANCDFTDPLALHAIKMIQNDLVDSYNGDMAKRDADGYFYIVGRKKRFLKLFGNRVNLDEIDGMIKREFEGLDCASDGTDELMKVYITDEKYAKQVEELITERTHINHTAFTVVVIDKIPRNESGKTLYKDLP